MLRPHDFCFMPATFPGRGVNLAAEYAFATRDARLFSRTASRYADFHFFGAAAALVDKTQRDFHVRRWSGRAASGGGCAASRLGCAASRLGSWCTARITAIRMATFATEQSEASSIRGGSKTSDDDRSRRNYGRKLSSLKHFVFVLQKGGHEMCNISFPRNSVTRKCKRQPNFWRF